MIVSIDIDERFLSNFGTGTLVGTLAKLDRTKSICDYKEIILRFPKPSKKYLELNKSPHEIIIYDHVIPLLIEDLLHLSDLGIVYKIEFFISDYK